MKLGVRGKLFVVSLALLGVGGLASGLYLERSMRAWLEARVEAELHRAARAARDAVQVALSGAAGAADPALSALSIRRADALADRLGASLEARVTVIAPDGRVLGDSEVPRRAVAAVENHGQRPEVREALAAGSAVARRYSTTVRADMLYVAVPYTRGERDARGVVRVATPLSEVDASVRRLRLLLLVAGGLGIGLAVFMSGLASHYLTRTLRALVDEARVVARGDHAQPVAVASHDEVGGLAGSLNALSAELGRTVAALARERDRLETVLEGMSDAVIALDADRRVMTVNAAGMALLGLAEPPRGRGLLEAVRAPALARLVEQTAADAPASAELDLLGPQARRVLARASRLRADGGTVIVIQDVTELRRLETMRRDFVANVSHELRTPVSVILANAETLQAGALDEPDHARRFVDGVHRNAQRLAALVSDLLDLSRIEAGELGIELRPVDVLSVVRTAVDAVAPAADERSTRVVVDADAALRARADPGALEQVLVNLLDNAIRHTPAGSRVVVRARADGAGVRLEVRDDGPGIAREHRARIFERFYRVDPGRSRELGGTGLGLAIVKHLVGAMGGEVGVAAAVPRGAVFWLTLRGAAG